MKRAPTTPVPILATPRPFVTLLVPLLALGAPLLAWCAPPSDASDRPAYPLAADTLTVDERVRLLEDLSILAHDSMEGRRAGTAGAERARRFLANAFTERGLVPLGGRTAQEFRLGPGSSDTARGVNVFGVVPGRSFPDRYIVVSAHYDHLGARGQTVYNGADDNASGTVALLALAAHFVQEPPEHSLLFVAFDGEELGLMGARAFVASSPVPLDSIVLNVNMDMIGRNAEGELYVAGTYHYPFLLGAVTEVAGRSRIRLLPGHDRPSLPARDDWTMLSDHAPFHAAGIPFLYFGVEEHPAYHQPTDDVEGISEEFFVGAVETVLDFIRVADARGGEILARRAGATRP